MVEQGYKRYSQEFGTVAYKVSGSQEGTELLQFDAWGWLEGKVTDVTVKVLGMKSQNKTIAYFDGEWMINYNPDNNYAMRISNPLFKNLTENLEEKNMEAVGEYLMEGGLGERVGTEVILGKECTVWEIASLNTKVWMWKGVNLREEAELMGVKVIKEAVEIDFSTRPAREELIVPKEAKGLGSYVWPAE